MTSEEVAKLRALCAKAAPGPWVARQTSADGWEHDVCTDGGKHVLCTLETGYDESDQSDAFFIAAAREALPRALDEIERLQADRSGLAKSVYKIEHALDASDQDRERLRKMITDLGLNPDAGSAR